MDKSYLITGGYGYIGGITAKLLADRDATIYIVDRENDSTKNPDLIKYRADFAEFLEFTAALPDVVMHFAADHLISKCIEDPIETYNNNVKKTIELLEWCAKNGVQYFTFSSTSAIYDPEGNPYSKSKAVIEQLLPDYGMKYMSLRYFNAAGSYNGELGYTIEPKQHLIPILVDCALNDKTFTIYSDKYDTPDGTCIRDYIHVTDIARAHISAVKFLESGGASGIYDVGTGLGYSVREVIDEVERVTNQPIDAEIGPMRPGDVARRDQQFNPNHFWRSTHTLTQMIEDEVEWQNTM